MKNLKITLFLLFLTPLLSACAGGVKLYEEKVSCEYDSQIFKVGEVVKLEDGCNTCVCNTQGELARCSEMDCEVVEDDGEVSEDVEDVEDEDDVEIEDEVGLANPASVKCEEDGFTLEIREDEEGNEHGVCIDEELKECDEWEYYREECMLGDKTINLEAKLINANGGSASGEAFATLSSSGYSLEMKATLPLLEEDAYYEVMLINATPIFDGMEIGKMVLVDEEIGDDVEEAEYTLLFESPDNYQDYDRVAVTIFDASENDEPSPLLEGNLKIIQ